MPTMNREQLDLYYARLNVRVAFKTVDGGNIHAFFVFGGVLWRDEWERKDGAWEFKVQKAEF